MNGYLVTCHGHHLLLGFFLTSDSHPFFLKSFCLLLFAASPCRMLQVSLSDKYIQLLRTFAMRRPMANGLMPKHVLLPMKVRHLTGCAEVITLLNRFVHGQSNTKTLEVETAMCNTITATKSVLPSNISTENNSVIHLCWDNFDRKEETPSGAGTTHSTHGIVIQEVTEEGHSREISCIQTKERKKVIQPNITELRPCFA